MKCRKVTETQNAPEKVTTKNGRAMLRAQCKECGSKVNKFVKA